MSHKTILGGWVQLNVRVHDKLDKALKEQAKAEDRSVSRVVRRALVEYLDRQKAQDNPAFLLPSMPMASCQLESCDGQPE